MTKKNSSFAPGYPEPVMEKLRVLSHPDCNLHLPGIGHPEAPSRVRRVLEALDGLGPPLDAEVLLPSEDDVVGALSWIHDRAYIDRVRMACGAGQTQIDTPDCSVSSASWAALMASSGLSLRAALDIASGKYERAFVVARPPSHHAERDRARGYCFFNGAALAAEVLSRASGSAILVVDIDAHHGNGTQRHFWERADVGYVSVHEYPAFPGSGSADEIGVGRGVGTTRNVPLVAGANDDTVARALDSALEEIGSRMRPAAVVVSAGFSGHEADPLSGLAMTATGFARLTESIVQCAQAWAEGRVLSVLEGGYALDSLGRSARAHAEVLARNPAVN